MAILEIVEWPSKILETKAEPVVQFDQELKQLVQDMHETMAANNGIGLAANQVGSSKRIFVIKIPFVAEPGQNDKPKWWHDKSFTFINPQIVSRSGKTKCVEGCLSFPDVYEYIDRADRIRIRALNEQGSEFEFEADDLFSICIQHELDHVDGIVFLDRMSRLKANIVKKRLLRKQLAIQGA